MSRRDSDSRHHRSRFDREPSPKRYRKDGKTGTERPTSNLNLDSAEHIERLKKPEVIKTDIVPLSKESDKKSNGYRDDTKNSSGYIEAPRSRSHFQHDERAGQVGRSFRHKETKERDWWKDSKAERGATNRSSNNDGSHKVEPDSRQPSKKRPSFRETKLPVNESGAQVTKTQVNGEGSEKKEERGKPQEKPPVVSPYKRLAGGRDPYRTDVQRMKFQSRDRYVGGSSGSGFGGSFRGRDRFNTQQGQSGGKVEKWKHDLYDEANKSPTSKNEEDQIAKPWVAETLPRYGGVMNLLPPETHPGDGSWRRGSDSCCEVYVSL